MVSENLTTFNGKEIELFEKGKPITKGKAIKLRAEPYEEPIIEMKELLDELIQSKQSINLEELIIGVWGESWDSEPDFVNYLIENKQYFPKLQHVFSGDMTYMECEISWIVQANYESFFMSFPTLKTFGVQGGNNLRFGDFSLPQLEKFMLFSGGLSKEAIQDLIRSNSFKKVEYLDIWLGTEEYGANHTIEDIKGILQMDMPNLKHLGLKNSDFQTEIVEILSTHPIVKQLKTLDISMGILKSPGGEILLKSDAFSHLEKIDCKHHFITSSIVNQLKAKYGDKIAIGEPEDDDSGDWFHVAVGE